MNRGADKFLKSDYDKFDQYGKDIAIKYLNKLRFNVQGREEDYRIDIVATKYGVDYRIEIGVLDTKEFTDKESFPYPKVNFFARKKKQIKDGHFFYVIICKKTGWCVYCNSQEIYKEKYTTKFDDKRRGGYSDVYAVPKELCKFRNLNY